MYKKISFKIAIYLLNQYRTIYPELPCAVQVIMARLGNLPTIKLMVENQDAEDYFSYFKDKSETEKLIYEYSVFLNYWLKN